MNIARTMRLRLPVFYKLKRSPTPAPLNTTTLRPYLTLIIILVNPRSLLSQNFNQLKLLNPPFYPNCPLWKKRFTRRYRSTMQILRRLLRNQLNLKAQRSLLNLKASLRLRSLRLYRLISTRSLLILIKQRLRVLQVQVPRLLR